jgi:hypothetical protein
MLHKLCGSYEVSKSTRRRKFGLEREDAFASWEDSEDAAGCDVTTGDNP